MRQWRVGSISMGLLLIGAGVLMFIDRIYGIELVGQFVKWWPIILILLGVEILGYAYFSREEQPKIKYDGFSIFIVIVIIFFSAGAYSISLIPSNDGVFNFSTVFNGSYKYESSFTKNLLIDASKSSKLELLNSYGNTEIEKSNTKNLEVVAEVIVRNNDKAYAKAVSDKVVELSKGDTIRVESKAQSVARDKSKVKDIHINFRIKVPSNIEVDIVNKYGNIAVEGVGRSLNITGRNGDISVDGVGGNLVIEDQYGDIEASNIKGKCEIRDKNGQVNISKVVEGLKINNQYGNIELNEIKGNVEVYDKNAEISGNIIGGSVNIDSEYCNITISDVKGLVSLTGKNGNMEIRDGEGKVKIKNQYGNVDLTNVYKAAEVVDKNGNVSLSSNRAIEGNISFENAYGNISLRIPNSQSASIKAYTKYGEINNDFNLNIDNDDNEKRLEGTIGKGGIIIDLKNRNGNIDIN